MTEVPQTPPPAPTATAPFSWGAFIGGAFGAVLIIAGLLLRRASPAFAAGLICGGCIIGLIGGICGASMVNTSFR